MEKFSEATLNVLQAVFFFLLGSIDYRFAYLVLIIVIDTGLGVYASLKIKEFQSKLFFKKTAGKLVLYLIALITFNAFDNLVNLPGTARLFCLIALGGLEMVSILKNIADLGYPQISKALLQAYRDVLRSAFPDVTPVETEEKEDV